MKKYLSMLLLAAAFLFVGCEHNDPDLVKVTIKNRTGHPIYVSMYEFKKPFDNYVIMDKVNNLGHITTFVKPGKYSIEASFPKADYYDSYLWTFKPGDKETFTFKSYK